jgi:LysR family transcriptional regulator, carnitine catabolism transcriptional activator
MNPVDLNFRHLHAFVTVARLSSFTRAAKVLHLSQPALTKQVRHLEEVLGVRLFDRDTRSVGLTRAGTELNPVAAQLLREAEALVFNTRELAAKARGSIRIAALPSVCSTILPIALARYRALHPGVSVVLRDVVAKGVISLIKAEDVDFGIGSAPSGDPEIRFTTLLSDRMVAAFPPGHLLRQSKSVKLKKLLEFPLILMAADSSVRKLVDGAFASIGRLVTPAFEATYMSTAAGMAKAGLGVAIVPSSAIPMGELAGLLTRPISQPVITRELGVLEKSARSLSPAAEGFLSVVKAVASTTSKASV